MISHETFVEILGGRCQNCLCFTDKETRLWGGAGGRGCKTCQLSHRWSVMDLDLNESNVVQSEGGGMKQFRN